MTESPVPPSAPRPNPLAALAVALLLLVALMGAFLIGSQRHPSPDTAIRGVVTTGHGSATATPDQLTFNATVTNQAGTTKAAMNRTNAGVRALTAVLRKDGIQAKDIQTTGISIDPQYNYDNGQNKIIGYTSTQQLQVLVRSLAKAGGVISDAATAAGNTISIDSISLGIGKQADLIAQARAGAVKDSRRAAEALARAAGRSLDQLVYVEEVTTDNGIRYPMAMATDLAGGVGAKTPVPVSPGSQKITVDVKVRWSLK